MVLHQDKQIKKRYSIPELTWLKVTKENTNSVRFYLVMYFNILSHPSHGSLGASARSNWTCKFLEDVSTLTHEASSIQFISYNVGKY